jgi:hypothetical protein
MPKHTRRMPAWLLGLLVAVAIFAAVILVMNALGYGDDPVVDGLGLFTD